MVYQCLSSCFRRELWVHPTCSETATAQGAYRSCQLPVDRGLGMGRRFSRPLWSLGPKLGRFLWLGFPGSHEVPWSTPGMLTGLLLRIWNERRDMSRLTWIYTWMRKSNKKEQLWMIKHYQWPKPAVHVLGDAKVWITPTCCWVMMSLQECRFCILMRQFTRGNAFSAHC